MKLTDCKGYVFLTKKDHDDIAMEQATDKPNPLHVVKVGNLSLIWVKDLNEFIDDVMEMWGYK